MNRKKWIFGISLSLVVAVLMYYLAPRYIYDLKIPYDSGVGDLSLNYWYFLSCPLTLLIYLEIVFLKEKKRRKLLEWNQVLAEEEYKRTIIKEETFREVFVPDMFNGLTEVNIAFCQKDLDMVPTHYCFPGLTKAGSKVPMYIQSNQSVFLRTIAEVFNDELPSFLFINFGLNSVENGIANILRMVKEKNPKIKIFLFCSPSYWEEKSYEIDKLINEQVVEKEKVTDVFFFGSAQEELLEKIKDSLS